tara:strand:+ start:3082 stop:4221 length:1140 start_codon:yes stop_codon:yes gene_type:complete
MSVIAFIPARKGSKSIRLKNIKYFCGRPLIYWNLMSLQESNVDKIVVATDSKKIKSVVNGFNFSKVELYDRKMVNAQDDSTTESVMLEYIEQSELSDSDIFILVQATSPFTQPNNFNEGLELKKSYDTVLSCAINKKFNWSEDGVSLSYDINNRPRRQNYKGNLIENGAFYISSVKDISKNKNRISGNIGIYKMPEYSSIEIDEPLDWIVAEKIMRKYLLNKKIIDVRNIKIILSDVDGVLTDGGMYYCENGDEMKKFCVYDGMAFKLLQEKGFKVGIITTENRNLNRRRAKKLNLDFDFHGAEDKLKIIEDLCVEESINIDQIAYIGDDINCFKLLSNVGLAACPLNAVDKIKNIPNIIQLNRKGGNGVFREFMEFFV